LRAERGTACKRYEAQRGDDGGQARAHRGGLSRWGRNAPGLDPQDAVCPQLPPASSRELIPHNARRVEVGTDFEQIERTCAFAFPADDSESATKELLGQLQWLADLGIDTVIGRLDGDDPRAATERLARHVIPLAAAIEGRRSSGSAPERLQ